MKQGGAQVERRWSIFAILLHLTLKGYGWWSSAERGAVEWRKRGAPDAAASPTMLRCRYASGMTLGRSGKAPAQSASG